MLKNLDALVIDLQDIGSRYYTFVYTMALCMREAAAIGLPGHRSRPAQPDRRRASRRQHPRREVFELRRHVPAADAARHDRRRAGALLQQDVQPELRSHRRADARLEAIDVVGRHRTAVGDPVAEHADGLHRGRLSGHVSRRRHEPQRRARHDASVRVLRRAVAQSIQARRGVESSRFAGSAVPAALLPPDVSEARRKSVRRASRCTSRIGRRSSRIARACGA